MSGTDTATAFTELLDRHAREIYAHILAMVPNKHDAAEVFQETSLTLWEKFADYQPNTDFRAWACKMAYFKVLTLRKRQFRLPRLLSAESLELLEAELGEMAADLAPRSEALTRCREKLSADDRALLANYYRHGATARSVADRTHRSVFQIYRALRRVHDALFECVNKTLAEEQHA